MKKIHTTVIVLFFTVESLSQHFQETRLLYSTPYCCASHMTAIGNDFRFDEYGRAYFHGTKKVCLACTHESDFTRYDFNSFGAGYHNFNDPTPHKIFPGHGDNFYGLTSTNNNYLIKMNSNGVAWNIMLDASNAYYHVSDDYFGNVFAINSSGIKKYDSTGVLKWSKTTGGSIVKADLAGNYYIGSSKYDSSGNLIRSLSYSVSDMFIDLSCDVYISGSSGITKLDSAGNLLYQYPAGGSKIAVDKNKNVYFLSGQSVKKLDSTGTSVLWTTTFPAGTLRGIGVDSLFNCYVMGDFSSGFVPPDKYYSYNTSATNSYYLFMSKLSSQLYSDTVKTSNFSSLHRVCAGDSMNVSFSFFLQQSLPPFKVQLSDSNGSFLNPVQLGTGPGLFIKVLIPTSVPASDGYRIRVKTTSGSPILIPNSDGPFRINKKTPSQITVTDYHHFNSGTYYGCGATPIQLHANQNVNFNYQWYRYVPPGSGSGYYSLPGATDSIYTVTSANNQYYYALTVTDTSTGCSTLSPKVATVFNNSQPLTISNLPSSVCLTASPILLSGQPSGGSFSGAGMYGNTFYPDSAGVGAHAITYSRTENGCIRDTTVTVTVNSVPSALITAAGSTTFCSGGSVVLNASINTNRTYQWKKGGNDIAGSTLSNYTASIGGVYKVTVTNSITGCSKTSVPGTVVTVKPRPNSTITPQGPTTFCAGGSVVLNANTGAGLTYQWKKGGTDIPAATSDNYTATIGGVYKVREVNSYGCAKLSTGIVVSVPCREEEELNEINGGISIFPNPATGRFTIPSPSGKISQIIVTNVSGQAIFKNNTENNFNSSIEIDLSDHPKGIYMVQVITGKEVYNQKIILN